MGDAAKAILIAGATELYDLLAPHYTQWAIYSAGTSDEVILPDSFGSLAYQAESRVSAYPIEKGSFSSYNKVETPAIIRVQLICMNKNMSRDDFLRQLSHMKNSTDIYDIATPDGFYAGRTMSKFDYKRTSRDGATMIIAETTFEQVRESGASTYSTSNTSSTVNSSSPSAATQKNAGTATVSQPSPAELLALQRGIQ